ncbi:DUF1178 family protein [Alphaproteobacteria bacterium]|jgi:hypothetical protein|nr:DUF1178 family protein [Alphaproteobacteria bacterium]
MIKYELICDLMHEFEGWFQTSAAFDAQNEAGFVTCPVCDSVTVRRALMTPNLASPKHRRDDMRHLPAAETGHHPGNQAGTITPSSQATSGQTASAHVAAPKLDPPKLAPSQAALGEVIAQLHQLQRKIKSECRDVGTDFATEVRKMHYGDSAPENIYGHSSAEERESLADEGIDIVTLPWLPPEH